MRQTSLISRSPGGGFSVRLTGTRDAPAPVRASGQSRVSQAMLDAVDRQRDADGYPAPVPVTDPALAAAVERQRREQIFGNGATAQPTTPDNVLDEFYPHEWLPEIWGRGGSVIG